MVSVSNYDLYKYGVGKTQTADKSQRNAEIADFAVNMIGQLLTSFSSYSADTVLDAKSNPKTETVTENKKQKNTI